MLGISEQHIRLPESLAPRAGLSSLAVALPSPNSRTFGQLFAILWESRHSKIRSKASSQTHRFAAAQSNSFRMTSLYKRRNDFCGDRRPGRIVGRESLLESADSGENRFQKSTKNKSLGITFLYNRKNNCPGIT